MTDVDGVERPLHGAGTDDHLTDVHPSGRIVVIGCGNLLAGDDAVGPALVRRLAETGVPDGVDVVDGGTAGMNLVYEMRGASRVIIVDACLSGAEPGAIIRLTAEEIECRTASGRLDTHRFRWDDALSFGRWLLGDEHPDDVLVYLVEAERVAPGTPMSPPVEDAVRRLLVLVRGELEENRGPPGDSTVGSAHERIGERVAARFEVTGIVQGVGFRPFVHRLATDLGLDGWVGNDSTQVFVEAVGSPAQLDEFEGRLLADAPPLARIDRIVRVSVGEQAGGAAAGPAAGIPTGFRIVASESIAGARTLVAPDSAVCDDCLGELFDPADRRHRHPFITCTNCGPRFTIIRDLPYDRPATTMAGFPMCAACAAEYGDPADRRYHAQPIACHDCGPTLVFRPGNGDPPSEHTDAIARAVDALRAGLTVAVKGLGGYHLACDATSSEAVVRLRDRKHRPDKPFAVLVRDLAAAHELAFVGEAEAAQLTLPARPIVLLRVRPDTVLSPLVAPANPLVGVMLPHTPIQHLLLADDMPPLVMTSGNHGGEPIAYRDDDAVERLGHLCDAMLTHDRPIHVPCDDSVVRVVDDVLLPIRRARGFAPVPVAWTGAARSVLAVGGELKNTFCLASPDHAWVSQHIGDMENLATLDAFEAAVDQFRTLHDVDADVVAVDAHPGYATTRWAHERYGDRVVTVQHHHAHVAAVMAEHGLDPDRPVLGFAFDGTGYGTDGAIWGGEVLVADATTARRVRHLAEVPLPGGDAAIRNPYRVALAHLAAAGIGWSDDLPPVQQLESIERGVLERQLTAGFRCIPTTSMGRLFDAVASLLGLRHRISFEAQAAIDLELAAERSARHDLGFRFALSAGVIDPAPVVRSIVEGRRAGDDTGALAFTFHLAVAEAIREITLAELDGCHVDQTRDIDHVHLVDHVDHVVLSGGVFQNALLTSMCVEMLRDAGVEPLTHRLVPPNDGGLALGQAFVAAHTRLDPVPTPHPTPRPIPGPTLHPTPHPLSEDH